LDLLANISLALKAAGYEVLTVSDGYEALDILRSQAVSLILADIAMPGMNGYQLYDQVRNNSEWVIIPFLFLTARAMDSDIRYGKQLGVDDYLTKPIEVEDLLAAVQGKLRRTKQILASKRASATSDKSVAEEEGTLISAGRLTVRLGQHQVWIDDQEIRLSLKEFKLLEYLAIHKNRVVSAPELIEVTHDLKTDNIEAGNLLRPLIRTVRRKLGYKPGTMGCIENVRGVGYRLISLQ
jgi:DNA-binding response OmpR family regulator